MNANDNLKPDIEAIRQEALALAGPYIRAHLAQTGGLKTRRTAKAGGQANENQ